MGDLLLLGSEELWISDGTSDGTRQLTELLIGPEGSQPDDFFRFGDVLLFTANDGRHGRELWQTDGTAEGTAFIKDLTPGFERTDFKGLFAGPGNSVVILTHDRGLMIGNDYRLWGTDGTEDGTRELATFEDKPWSFVELGEATYFLNKGRIWRTDGTPEGTTEVSHGLTFIHERSNKRMPIYPVRALFRLGDNVYFFAQGGRVGYLGRL